MTVIAWPEIEGFHNIRKLLTHYPELACGDMRVQYRPKVKLHGTNAGIQCHRDGRVVAQSRTAELVDGADNAGFAKWVKETESHWSNRTGLVFFGEWCGPGIQKGVAVNQIPTRCFAVFAARDMENPETLFVIPSELQILVSGIPNVYVLPWAEPTITIDWSKTNEELVPMTEFINKHVMAIEECDPWVESTFGVKGTGEGLVFYPVSHLTGVTPYGNNVKNFENLCFKAKGEKHRVVKSAGAATVNPEVAANADQFVNLVLTEARLDQGATTVNNGSQEFDKKLTGAFVAWVLADVQKETQDELQASGLDWKAVQKPLTDKARKWYLGKA